MKELFWPRGFGGFLAQGVLSPAEREKLAELFGLFDWVQIGLILGGGLFLIVVAVRAMDAAASRRQFDPLLFGPLRSLIKWVGLLITLSLILGKFGFNVVTALSTVLALIAVGFVAVWSVLSNFLCTFLLLFYRPFRVDDYIEFPGEEGIGGRVVALTTLYTVLEDDEGAVFHIPNNQFFQKVIKKPRRPGKGAAVTGKNQES